MGSMAEMWQSMPECAARCISPKDVLQECPALDLSCICGFSLGNETVQACVQKECTIRQIMNMTNQTMAMCHIEPRSNYTFIPVLITFLVLAGLFVLLRWFVRFLMGMKLWWDDWLNFLAYLFCIAYTILVVILKSTGLGLEVWAVKFEDLGHQLQGYYILALLFFIARFLVRLSILFFYLRIFRATKADKLIKGTLVSTIVVFVPLLLTAIFQCRPLDYNWTRIEDGQGFTGTCVDETAFLWAGWIILLINDFWILVLPIPLIARLQLSLRKKILVLAMFGMGIGVIVTSIYKLTLIHEYTSGTDPTSNVVSMSIWSGVEINLGVIFACLPSMPALFKAFTEHIPGRMRTSQSGHGGAYGTGPASRYDIIDKTEGGKNVSISLPASVASRDADKQIRKTTTIHQNVVKTESESHLPLRDGDGIELGDTVKGITRATAWA